MEPAWHHVLRQFRLNVLTQMVVWRLPLDKHFDAAIAAALVVSEKAISKHIANIFLKLDLPPSDDDNRRVMAVLAFLNA